MALTTVSNAGLGGSIDLTSKVTGTLPIANGGTNSTSTTFVNLASNVTGTMPVANGGSGRTAVTGNVLQVIRASTATITTTSSLSMVDITDLTVNITPSATSSKIYVIMNVMGMASEASALSGVSLRIYQASDISGEVMNIGFGDTAQLNQSATLTALESPSSTSELTYKGQCRNREAVNVRVNNSSDPPSITVMEIA